MSRFGETSAEKAMDGAFFKSRRWLAVAALAVVLVVLAPELRLWLTSYLGVVLHTDVERVGYRLKKGRRQRTAKAYRAEIGVADGEPFWIHVDREMYDRLKIGTVVEKRYFTESPALAIAPRGPELEALRARYPVSVH